MKPPGIAIATINGSSRVYNFLESIRAAGDEYSDLILVDDGSTERELTVLRELCRYYKIEFREHRRNQGIAASWNHGMAYLKERGCELGVVCNDDIVVTKGWLEAIRTFHELNPVVAMVGLHATINGALQCTDNGIKKFEGDVDFSVPHRGICSNGFCFGLSVGMWERAGFFNETYLSYYEETDFGARASEGGCFSYNIPWPVIQHEWGTTMRENPNLLASIRMQKSRENFVSIWKKDISALYSDLVTPFPKMEMSWVTANGIQRGYPIDVVR